MFTDVQSLNPGRREEGGGRTRAKSGEVFFGADEWADGGEKAT